MKKLKIAQVAPLWFSIPPEKYGGIEWIVYSLCEKLTKFGHDVTLFASGDSKVPCQLVPGHPQGLIKDNISWNDRKTGFLINRSQNDIRGGWIVKKTGVEGLCKAVERIYAMPVDQYRQMRRNCRKHVEKKFTVERMVDEYEQVYYKVLEKAKK